MNNGKICVSVCCEQAGDFIRAIRSAEKFADVIELRFDCLDREGIQAVLETLPKTEKQYLFTLRPREQGGKRDLTVVERLEFWENVSRAEVGGIMIDIEFDPALLPVVNAEKIDRIISFHQFDGTACDPVATWAAMSNVGNGPFKIAVAVEDITDSIAVWQLLSLARAQQKPIIPIAMGEAGKWTRILGIAHGAYLTYASLGEESETAPGQITAQDLIETYRVKTLNIDTRVFGVLGNPVSQSLSTYMHNPAFAATGLNAVFIPFLVKDIGAFMQRMVRPETREIELNFAGFSVTMPHKQSVMKHLDTIDPTAEKIGAVNTIKIENGRLTGYNTDAHGFVTPLKKKFEDLNGVRAGVFGAGGAARAVVYALKQENADVTVCSRSPRKAEGVANEFGVRFSAMSDFKSQNSKRLADSFDIIVDTTPLGMKGPQENDSLFAAKDLQDVKFVYDLVTTAHDTPIIREAKKAGVAAIGGVEMLVAQGAKQFEIWTGAEAPLGRMNAAVSARMTKINS